jgi:hypothetical protein
LPILKSSRRSAMKRFGLLVLLSVLTFSISPCRAEIPKLINYQGMLTDDSGSPLTDTVDVTFIIYDDPGPTGGNIKWEETQYDVSVINGLFNVILGTANPINLAFDQDYWLDITVEGEHMPARLRFTSVGYAYRAMVADTAYVTTPGAGSNWAVSDSVLYTNKKWGIARGGAGNILYGDSAHTHVNLGIASVTGHLSGDFRNCTVGGGEQNNAGGEHTTVGGGFHNVISSIGSGGIIGGGSNNSIDRGMATIGGGYDNQSSAPYATIGGGWSNRALGDYFAPTIAGGWENTTLYAFATVGGGHKNTAAALGATVPGGEQDSAVGNFSFAAGYRAKALHTGSFVWADSTNADFSSANINEFAVRASGGIRVVAKSSSYGGYLDNQTGGGDGLRAYANVSQGFNWGAIYAINYGTSPAVYADGGGDTAGYFNGSVVVTGTLYKGALAFVIDDPLDPANKYLYHSGVESPDMKNVYDGVVTLDGNGEARVELPQWFEALNRDFRYQLTCIGAFAPVYIAEKISNNGFKIAGGHPGTEVSWQLTGIRQDPYAEKHRIPVEEEKPADERGKYLHPNAYGMPENMGAGYSGDKDRIR